MGPRQDLCESSAGLLKVLAGSSVGPRWVLCRSSKVLCACEVGPRLITMWLFCGSLARVPRMLWVATFIKMHMCFKEVETKNTGLSRTP